MARNTIDLYLALSHEEANPVPADELVRGRVALSLRRHEPVGVVVAITPYNGAIIMAFQKLIAGLDGRELGDSAAEPAHADLVVGLRALPPRRPGCPRAC